MAQLSAVRIVRSGYCCCTWKRVEIEIDDDLVQEIIRRYHLADAREAVYLAVRTLLGESDGRSEWSGYWVIRIKPGDPSRLIARSFDADQPSTAAWPVVCETPWFGDVVRQAVPSFRPAARLVATGERPP